ncbi:MAG TPA: tetratricopeptide repeat protein [Chloroflexia bacterium]|nr:tetratricopeptide repeat protein [Chloroflexia bacterium]
MIDNRNSVLLPRLLTKLIVPRFKKTMLGREHLIETLHTYDHVKLVTISAPAGYGKTILLSDYANRGFKPCSWLSFDYSDNDEAVFVESLILSIKQVFPQFAAQSGFIAGLVEALRDPENGVEVCTRQIINEIYTTIKVNFDLILDDYHIVDNQPKIDRLVNTLLLYLPPNCRILLSCRTLPGLDLTSLRIQGNVTGLGVKDLKMNAEEVYTLLSGHFNLPISRQDALEVTEKTEGWVTGVMLACDTVLHQLDTPAISATQTQLFNYLSTQILQNLPEGLQTFLLESSVLQILPVEMCAALLERTNTIEMLADCEHRRLFIDQVHAGPETGTPATTYYRYHSLFRNFLAERLRKTAPERYRYLLRRSAQLFLAQNDVDSAMVYLLQAEAYQEVIDLLKQVGEKELHKGRLTTLQNWLAALPASWFWSEPDMVTLKVKLLGLGGEFEAAHNLLNQLQVSLSNQCPPPLLKQVQVQIIEAKLYRTQVQYEKAIQVLQEALSQLLSYECDDSLLHEPSQPPVMVSEQEEQDYKKAKAEIYLELGVNLGMNGKLQPALEGLEKAQPLFEELGSKESLARLHQCFSAVCSGLGEVEAARQHLVTSLDCWESTGNMTGLVNTLVNLGSVYLSESSYSQAQEVLEKAISVATQAGYLAGHAYALAFMGDLLRDTDQFEPAQACYNQSLQLAESSNEKRLILLVGREIAANLRRLGKYSESRQALKDAFNQLPDQQKIQGYYLELLRLLETGLELDQANYQEARLLLEKGAGFYLQKDNKREHAVRLFLEARLNFGLGKLRPSLSLLSTALSLAQEVGNPAIILKQEAWYAQSFLRFAQINQAKLSRFQSVIEALLQETDAATPDQTLSPGEAAAAPPELVSSQNEPDSASAAGPAGLRPKIKAKTSEQGVLLLEGYSLGKPHVVMQGTVVQDWRTVKAVELLFLLMDQGRSLRKEFIINALWPDVEACKTENLFKTTLYRLRQALCPEWISRDGPSYSLRVAYRYDAAEFQKNIRQGDRLLMSNPDLPEKKEQALGLYREAADLYRGGFLEGIYSEWSIERQQQLEMLYHELLIKQSQLYFQMGHYEPALHTVEQYLQFDSFSETAHLIRLEIYKELGNSAMLSHSFELYTQMLKELNQEPSAEARLLFRA